MHACRLLRESAGLARLRTLIVRGTVLAIVLLTTCAGLHSSLAQQKIGYVDTQYILEELPEYATVQQKLDKLETDWRSEIEEQEKRVQSLRDEYQAWELLYTEEERKEKRQAINEAQAKVEQLRQQYFGPEGQLYTRQKELMRPIQERILNAAEEVATEEGYDYVLDKGGKVLFVYARQEHDISDSVLEQLGITPGQATSSQ